MKNFRCIIIEDEPLAAEILEDYIQQLPSLDLRATFSDAISAQEYLADHVVDLIFLDLHLPKLKGFDFLKSLIHPPKVIVTTAYQKYALEGFELEVVDYLLKPIEFSRLLKAINKLDQTPPRSSVPSSNAKSNARRFLFFNVNKKNVKVWLDEIQYIESLKEYVKIQLHDSHLVTKFQIGEMEGLLQKENFLRIHRSYLVAQEKIQAYSPTTVEVNDQALPIGRSYKQQVLQVLDKG